MSRKTNSRDKKKTDKNSGGGSATTYKGILEVTRSGLGYVIVEGLEKDIIVKREKLHNALHGDEVRVEVSAPRGRKFGARPEGTIKEVLKRKQVEFSGILQVHKTYGFLIPDSDRMPVDIFIPTQSIGDAVDGDRVVVRIVEWPAGDKNPVGEVISVLTNESVNEIAMQGLLMDAGFPLTFTDGALETAARFPEGVDEDEAAQRRDMRGELTFTIDPVDAKDFDDAISVKPLGDGYYEIGVHIADVGHYVVPGSELDEDAYRRATSVYLPDRVLPMLPERLSNNLCSLRPNEDKYAFSAIFNISKGGKVKDIWLGKTVIRSKRRFTYEEVQEIIEGAEGDHKEEVMLLNSIAQTFRAERFRKGAINFSSQEVRFKLDETGKPIGIVVKESKESHQLVEEFMLLANRTVAEYVSQIEVKNKPVPFPYRVHDVPDEEKLKVFTTFAAQFGIKFSTTSPENIAKSFNEMLEKVQGKPEQHVLESLGIRTMAKAVYTTDNIGHYGLGFEDYCHFTSPIRRYPDVLVHRILLECLEQDIKPIKNLEQMCRHCSAQERSAMEAERSANKYKQVEFMQDYIGEDFDAVISGVATFGFWAETVEHKCEGMVSITDLQELDDFSFVEAEYALVGRKGLRFSIGDKVKIRVVAANLQKRQLDYTLVELLQAAPKAKVRSKANTRDNNKKETTRKSSGRKK